VLAVLFFPRKMAQPGQIIEEVECRIVDETTITTFQNNTQDAQSATVAPEKLHIAAGSRPSDTHKNLGQFTGENPGAPNCAR
jgi:hypothetical protein